MVEKKTTFYPLISVVSQETPYSIENLSIIFRFFHLPVPLACGRFVVLHDNITVTIHSPGYPWPYRKARSCSWRVCPPQGKKLEFHFTDFDLRTFDKLHIINGKTTILKLLCNLLKLIYNYRLIGRFLPILLTKKMSEQSKVGPVVLLQCFE